MPPAFLNSREDAYLIWAVIVLGYVFYKDPRGIGGSFLAVFRSLLHPKLLLLFGTTMLYSAALLYAAERAGVWHTAIIRETVYWFIGTGGVLVAEAVGSGQPNLRRVFRRVIAITVLTEFAVKLYAFPLAIELVVAFVALAFVGMQVVAPYDSSVTPVTRKFIDGVVVAVGLLYLVYFLLRAFSDLGGFLTTENAEGLLVGPALTIALIPLVYGFAWLSRREQESFRRQFQARLDSAS